MTATDLSPREAIDLFVAQRLNGMYLPRIFGAWRSWIVPGEEDAGQLFLRPVTLGDAEPELWLFSDADAVAAARAQPGAESLAGSLINASGTVIFAALTDNIARVKVNPFTGADLYYTRAQFPRLREWADIVEVERALADVIRTGTGLDIIRNFSGYYVAVNREGLQGLALVPDDKGRRLAAVFTARDALEAYLDEYGAPDTLPLGMTGAQLFTALPRMPLDGFIVNPEGPAAYGFAMAFAGLVMRDAAQD
jgi:hypothetical protein